MKNELFRLTTNSFHVLKAKYECSRQDIAELVDDAEFDDLFPADDIHRSQQSLVTPKSRLVEELSWLPELSNSQVSTVVDLLHEVDSDGVARAVEQFPELSRLDFLLKTVDFDKIVQVIQYFPELAKANVLAHLCSTADESQLIVQALAAAWNEIDEIHLLQFINGARTKSGFPSVDLQQVRTALKEIENKHSNAAAANIWTSGEPGALMDKIVGLELASNPSSTFLGKFVRAYDARSETDLARISSDIDEKIDRAKIDNDSVGHCVDEISDLLHQWDEVNQPVQIYEQHQGHEEGRSKKIYEKVRSLCLELANDRGGYKEAKRLSEALLRTFPELEAVAEVLKNDVAQLETLDEQQQQQQYLLPLVEACEAAKSEILQLKRGLAADGFSATGGSGPLPELVTAFRVATSKMADKSIPFLAVRDLALFVNNERNDPETAFRLTDSLLRFREAKPSEELVEKLEEERSVLHKNWKMEALNSKAGNLPAMSQVVDDMLLYARGSDRSDLLQLKANIDEKKREDSGSWIIWAIIAAIVGFVFLSG